MSDYFLQHAVHTGGFSGGQSWVVLSSQEARIKSKIERGGLPLKDWDVQINYGIKTGFNDAFIIDEKTRSFLIENSPEAEAIIRPILRGRDIKRYQATFNGLWLINTHNGLKSKGIERIDAQTFPSIHLHLAQHRDKLERRQDKGDHWTNLRNCAYLEELEKDKIIWIELTDHANFFLDTNGFYINNTVVFMTGERLKFITGFLNSKICDWYFSTVAATSGAGTTRWFKIYVEQIPVPISLGIELESRISVLVEQIQEAKLNKIPTDDLEAEIENILCIEFGLNADERSLIQNWSR